MKLNHGEFLNDLVEMENARNPSLDLQTSFSAPRWAATIQ